MRYPWRFWESMILTTLLVFGSCGEDEAGMGILRLELWGEDYIEEGIPADDFADGWSVRFDHFRLHLGALRVARTGQAPEVDQATFRVWDLAAFDGPRVLLETEVPSGRYDQTAYVIAPVTGESTSGNVDEAVLQHMKEQGWSLWVEGRASKGDRVITFSWGFDTTATYDPCHSVGEVEDGKVGTLQITIHGDHFFYDSAVSEDPSLRFEDLAAADRDGNGAVTPEELKAVDIRPLEHYGVGSLEIDDLWAYLSHMSRTVGHIDGEGHCEVR